MLTPEESENLASKLQDSHGTCLEVVKRLAEISEQQIDHRTAWDAVNFAKAVIETLKLSDDGLP